MQSRETFTINNEPNTHKPHIQHINITSDAIQWIIDLYSQLASNINPHEYQAEMIQTLFKKRYSVATIEKYVDLLTIDIIYFRELQEELGALLKQLLKTNNIPNKQELEAKIVLHQSRTKTKNSQLSQQDLEMYQQKFHADELLDRLTTEYAYCNLSHSFMIETLFALSKNKSFLNSLNRNSSESCAHVINEYISSYVHSRLQHLTFNTLEKK
ncbi:hypothetical protein ACFDTO_35100 [Microbacteriaceae bacterium 4G12]